MAGTGSESAKQGCARNHGIPTGSIRISSSEPVPDNLVNHSPGQNKREMNKNVRTGAAGALAGMPGNKPVSPLSV